MKRKAQFISPGSTRETQAVGYRQTDKQIATQQRIANIVVGVAQASMKFIAQAGHQERQAGTFGA